jgi:site-specific recombinase XerD
LDRPFWRIIKVFSIKFRRLSISLSQYQLALQQLPALCKTHGSFSQLQTIGLTLFSLEKYYFLDQCAVRLSRSRINKILKEHCKNAGVRKEVRCSPHDCRHYFAQKQLRNGIDIYSLSRLMGHFDTQITSKYLRGLEQEDILQIGRLHSPLNNLDIRKH